MRTRSIWTATCATALLLLQPARCQRDTGVAGAPDAAHYRYRIGHSVAVAGNNLYIEGGEVVSGQGNETEQSVISNKTAIIPLDKKWNTTDPGIHVIDSGEFGLRVTETALWPAQDGQTLFSWGGSVGSAAQLLQDSQLRELRNRWSNDSTVPRSGSGSDGEKIARTRGGSWTTCNGVGFLLGGVTPLTAADLSPPGTFTVFTPYEAQFGPVPGLVTFDMRTRRWDNVSADGFGPDGPIVGGTHYGGAAVCLPTFGTNGSGLVVFLGGKQATNLRAPATFSDMLFEAIYFYDIGTKKFHSQFATLHTKDALPASRTEFCAVAARPSSNSSYEIVVFGGRNGPASSDVRILTVPGFRWFKVPDAEGARYQHGCAVVGSGRRQMLSVGGIESWESKFGTGISDPWKNGLKIFDMTTLKWSDTYDPDAPAYETPAEIKSWYDAGGRQSVKWDKPELEAVFAQTNSVQQPTESGSGSGTPTPLGVMVGSILGGLAALVITIGVFVFLLRRSRRAKGDKTSSPETFSTQNTDQDDSSNTLVTPTSTELPTVAEKGVWSPASPYELGKNGQVASVTTVTPGAHEMHAGDVPREMPNNEIPPPHELPANQARSRPRQEDKTLGSFIPPDTIKTRKPRDEAGSPRPPWEDKGYL
ncbi:hypothetical protein PpBr36_02681 [Pyricularia pennisetigena]|uniref:hypothetical protein n=1 Tax=Pyricularia pennisetigena TaxID=1578925 RepID=UPI0011529006|nr:hypothetical protein PpBr36_02681 [Pyricularia pennisetigena]TLS31357.1 hypothetical protein PpBr36_02681 [Pyricularia pennisetigena]